MRSGGFQTYGEGAGVAYGDGHGVEGAVEVAVVHHCGACFVGCAGYVLDIGGDGAGG